jgi:hypothetical protein
MSAKINNIEPNQISNYQASYLKYNIKHIERMINHNIRDKIFDFNNNSPVNDDAKSQKTNIDNNNKNNINNYKNKIFIMNNIYNSTKCTKIERGDIESINVRNVNSKYNNYLEQSYQDYSNKLSINNNVDNDIVQLANSLNVYGMQTNIKGSLVNYEDLKIPYKLGDSMYMIKENDDMNLSGFNSLEMNARHGFNIHQTMPDPGKYDFFTKEKDEFVCQGKRVEIEDSDYQDVNEFVTRPKENSILELMFDLNDDILCSFLHIDDDLILLATEKGEFSLMKPNKSKLTFVRCILNPKYNGKDYEFYKQGKKSLVDICLDSSGNLIILNRWNFVENDSFQMDTKYTVELFSFNRKKVDGICYMRTICCLSNEEKLNEQARQSNFTRLFNDEKKNCIILIDSSNNKIYWHKKSNGSKKRCLKSQDSTLESPKSLAIVIDDLNSIEIIFICTNSGLVATSKSYTIKHEVIMPIDIYYDLNEKSIYFISSNKIYEGSLFENSDNSNKNIVKSSEDLDIKYKLLFSCNTLENKRDLKRIVTSKNFIYVLFGPESNCSSSKATIYAYTKFKN